MAEPLGDAHLVVTWTHLRRAGWTPARIRAQLDARRWRRHGHAIALHNGPLSRVQWWQVARIHGSPRSLFTGFTATELYGMRGWERDTAHLLVPLGARALSSAPTPLVLHRVRHWSRVRRDRSGPIHVRPYAVLVAASSFTDPRPACGLLAAAVQQKIASVPGLRAALDASIRLRHRRLLRMSLEDIAQGSQALSEIDFLRLCRRYGLPRPLQQRVRREPGGRRRYLDASWRRADGRLVVAEIDGALHLDQRRWWSDQLRQNEITLGDAVVLRFPSTLVRTQPDVVARQLRRALLL